MRIGRNLGGGGGAGCCPSPTLEARSGRARGEYSGSGWKKGSHTPTLGVRGPPLDEKVEASCSLGASPGPGRAGCWPSGTLARLLALPAPGSSWLLGSLSKEGGWGCFLPPLPIPPQPASVTVTGNGLTKPLSDSAYGEATAGGTRGGAEVVGGPPLGHSPHLPDQGPSFRVGEGPWGHRARRGQAGRAPSGQRGSRSRRASSASPLPSGPCPPLGDIRGSRPTPQPGTVAPGTLLLIPLRDALPCLPRFAQPWPAGLLPAPLRYLLKQLCPPAPLASCLSVCWSVFEG